MAAMRMAARRYGSGRRQMLERANGLSMPPAGWGSGLSVPPAGLESGLSVPVREGAVSVTGSRRPRLSRVTLTRLSAGMAALGPGAWLGSGTYDVQGKLRANR